MINNYLKDREAALNIKPKQGEQTDKFKHPSKVKLAVPKKVDAVGSEQLKDFETLNDELKKLKLERQNLEKTNTKLKDTLTNYEQQKTQLSAQVFF